MLPATYSGPPCAHLVVAPPSASLCADLLVAPPTLHRSLYFAIAKGTCLHPRRA